MEMNAVSRVNSCHVYSSEFLLRLRILEGRSSRPLRKAVFNLGLRNCYCVLTGGDRERRKRIHVMPNNAAD